MPIDPTKPVEGSATTQSVRDNFQAVVDDFLLKANASDDFLSRLAGLNSDGLLINYSGDLDDIKTNTINTIFAGSVTNEPPELTSIALLMSFYDNTGNQGNQLCYGTNSQQYFMWMRHWVNGTTWTAWKIVIDGNSLSINASGEVVIGGNDAATNLIVRETTTGALVITGGNDSSDGGVLLLFGGAGALPGAWVLQSNGINIILWNEAVGQLTFETGSGAAKVLAMTLDNNQNIIANAMPTSAAGLPSGALWNNLGVVNIAP